MRKISISDVTLSVLHEDKKTLTFREKLNIASVIDSCGIDVLELPVFLNEKENTVVYRTIASTVQNVRLSVQVNDASCVENAWNSIKDAKMSSIQVVLPASTVQMEYQYHIKASKMLDKIKEICERAKAYTDKVELSLKDATRAEDGFVKKCVLAAQEAGATAVTLCDDAGVFFPEDFYNTVKELKADCNVEIWIQPSDKLKMAAACAVESIKAGADGVKCAVANDWLMPNVLVDIFRVKGADLQAESSLNVTKINSSVQDILAKNVTVEEAIVDVNITGLDANCTIHDIAEATKKLGYELSNEDIGKVFEEFKRVALKRGVIGSREFEAIVATSAMQVPSTYHLVNYVVNNGNIITATASITLEKNGEKLSGVSTGDGPIDAAFHAIEQIIGHHYELDDFQVQSVTKGREAVGSSLIRLRADGKLYSGNGVSTDIVGACIRAYVNALNKIVYEEN